MEPRQPISNLVVKRCKSDNTAGEALREDNLMPRIKKFLFTFVKFTCKFYNKTKRHKVLCTCAKELNENVIKHIKSSKIFI